MFQVFVLVSCDFWCKLDKPFGKELLLFHGDQFPGLKGSSPAQRKRRNWAIYALVPLF